MKKIALSGLFIFSLTTAVPAQSVNFSNLAKTSAKVAKVVGWGSYTLGTGIATYLTACATISSLKERSFSFGESVALPLATLGFGLASYSSVRLFLRALKK